MANWTDLEDRIIDTIQDCCRTKEDKIAAKRYYENTLVNDVIDEALEE